MQAANYQVTYSMTGPSTAMAYFSINSETGNIFIQRDLENDNLNVYTVSFLPVDIKCFLHTYIYIYIRICELFMGLSGCGVPALPS